MKKNLNLDELLKSAPSSPRGRAATYPAKVAKERTKEINRRSVRTRETAVRALIAAHQADYDELVVQARAKVTAESGPLPGDPVK